ncbi:nucleoside hydrolase [Adhaeretor mobilis]|uniref:Pyrimidine-specific ribonucleoside hydrolase RihB n=1 Tax=Adhaeretor mobilis TaxID=1930276 RepID=A0A517MZA9_9BACT|nr:nucleoside hydrolase [Adhaeretor mobilis]QDT00148.1 Pyrimidine-specific ribonucleoside hydrolase RihB [Adhaeretor mobilis]
MDSEKPITQPLKQPLTGDSTRRKIILDVDPGVGDALAVCLALVDPGLEVVAVTATGGNVSPQQASHNVQAIVEQLDPPLWPRIGNADADQQLLSDNRQLWGTDGFCGVDLGCAELHNRHSSTKILSDAIRKAPGDVTVIAGGPLSNLASVFQVEPDLAMKVGHLMIVGGTHDGSGDVTPAAEFNMYCDPEAARVVINTPATKTMLPLGITSQASLTFDALNHLPKESTNLGRLLHKLLPPTFQAFHQKLGLEGIVVPEAVAVAAVLHPEILTTESFPCDVETTGELTLGATVIDRRRRPNEQANIDVAVEIDAVATVDCLLRALQHS